MFCLLFVLLDFLLKAVQKYEKYVYVTPILNPFPRGKDLPSLRSNFERYIFCVLFVVRSNFAIIPLRGLLLKLIRR